MNKSEFLSELEKGLSGLPKEDIRQTIDYYSEMIDDRVEDGTDEELAVEEMGGVKEICDRIWSETSLPKIVEARLKRSRALKAWELVLIILGSPVWLPVLVAVAAVILAAYAVLWSVVVSFYAVGAALGGSALGGVAVGVISIVRGSVGLGICLFGAAMICAGACIFALFGCNLFARLSVFISKMPVLWLKSLIIGRREADEDK